MRGLISLKEGISVPAHTTRLTEMPSEEEYFSIVDSGPHMTAISCKYISSTLCTDKREVELTA